MSTSGHPSTSDFAFIVKPQEQEPGEFEHSEVREPLVQRPILRRKDGRILREAVEYSLVEHCNLACAGCDHFAPHLPKRFAAVASFAADMEALASHLHVRVLRLVGGEPLLHPELTAFIRAGRAAGIADEVWLWTNGLLLHQIDPGVLEEVDVVRVSVYPGVNIRADLTQLARKLAESGRTRLQVVRVEKFFHQLLNDPVADAARVRRTYQRCKETHVWNCHTVHEGHYFKCAKPPTMPQRLARAGVEIFHPARDGVALHDNPSLARDLERYLLSPDPLAACAWCLGTDGKSFPHHQLNADGLRQEQRRGIDERTLSAHPVRQFLRDIRDGV